MTDCEKRNEPNQHEEFEPNAAASSPAAPRGRKRRSKRTVTKAAIAIPSGRIRSLRRFGPIPSTISSRKKPNKPHTCLCNKIMNKLNSLSGKINEALRDSDRALCPKRAPKAAIDPATLRKLAGKGDGPKAAKRRPQSHSFSKAKNSRRTNFSLAEKPELEELNPTVTLAVTRPNEQVDRFQVRKFDSLGGVFEYYQKMAGSTTLLFTLDGKPICLNKDSYGSLNMTDESVVKVKFVVEPVPGSSEAVDLMKFKVRYDEDKRKYFYVYSKPREKMCGILRQVAEKMKKSPDKLCLYFDNKLLKSYYTASKMGLGGGECFLLKMAK